MPRPAPSSGRAVPRTPKAPRSTRPPGGSRCRPRSARPADSTASRRGPSAGSSTAWSPSMRTDASSVPPFSGTTRAAPVPRQTSSPRSAPSSSPSARASCRSRRSRSRSSGGCATMSPTTPRASRLRGFGPAGESPRGPVIEELVTDRSDASGTGYWNPETGGYDRELLVAALGHDAILPRVLGPQEWVENEAGRRVGPGAGDNAGAALGLGAGPGDVVVSIGTSGTVFAVSEKRTIDPSGTVAGFADCTGRFLPLVATLNAARVLDAIGRVLDVDHAELSRLALAARPGAAGLTLVPYFEGERTPNLPDATASLLGMTLASTTRENVARAAVEGMLSGLAAGLEALRALGVPLERALLVGGGAQSTAVREIAPLVLGLPVEVPEPGEYVALGAARQAASVLAA